MERGRIVVLFLLALAGLALALPASAEEGLDVVKLVVAQAQIQPGSEQIVQVTLRNAASRSAEAGLVLEVRDDQERRIGQEIRRRLTLAAQDERRVFFRVRAPNAPGTYALRLEVFTPDFKRKLLPGAPVFLAPFVVQGAAAPPRVVQKPAAPTEKGAPPASMQPPTFQPPSGLKFEKPDLTWENFSISPASLLLGEKLRIRADLRNVGGDLARDFVVEVTDVNVERPNRPEVIARTTVPVLAPGDKLELEFEKIFPDDALLGDYRIVMIADANNNVSESSEDNNRVATEQPIRLSQIKLIFPEANYSFEESGLFLFRWDSLRYDEFKVQISTDPNFENPGDQFDIPQGDKWSKDKEVVPLEGELPDMARGLMEKNKTSTIYWRVAGRESKSGQLRYSKALPFSIALSPRPRETPSALQPAAAPQPRQPAVPQGGAPTAPTGGGTPPAPPAGGSQAGSPPAGSG